MKNYLKVDSKNSKLVMDKTFAKKSQIVGSDEYDLLQAARRDYPKFEVITKTNKKTKTVERYDGLTYDYMERYIAANENAEEIMKVYRQKRFIAECHSVRYHNIRNWFFEMYPEVKEFGVVPIEVVEEAAAIKVVEKKAA